MRKSYIAAIVCFIVLSLSNVAFSEVLFTSGHWGVIEIKNEMNDDVFYHLVYINCEVEFSIVGMKNAGEENTAILFNKKSPIMDGYINMRVDSEAVSNFKGEVVNYQAVVIASDGDIINQMKFGQTLLVEVNPALPPNIIERVSKINLEGFAPAYYKFREYVNQ